MKVFIWERIGEVSSSWHSEGGLVVFAETEERARELANETVGVTLQASEVPDRVSIADGPEGVITFPDAGCC